MRALQDLRNILKTLAQEVEVLPAVGGAVEDVAELALLEAEIDRQAAQVWGLTEDELREVSE